MDSIASILKTSPEFQDLQHGRLMAADGSAVVVPIEQHEEDISSALAELQKLKALQATLSKIAGVVDKRISIITEAVLPAVMNRGINILPDDVLAIIFELSYGGNYSFTRTIVCVCRRFYNIAIRTCKLWTNICNKPPWKASTPDNFHTFLDRSRKALITVDLELYAISAQDCEFIIGKFLPSVLLHRPRWKELHVSIGEELGDNELKIFGFLEQSSVHGGFPALEKLSISYEVTAFEEQVINPDDDDSDAKSKNFFQSWELPTLRTLDFINFIPRLNHGFASVTRCDLCFTTCASDPIIWDVKTILDFLISLPALEELTLHSANAHYINRNHHSTTLPNLRKLSFTANSSWQDTDSISDMINALETPAIEDLLIKIRADDDDHWDEMPDDENWLACFFIDGRIYPEVKNLYLKLENFARRDLPLRHITSQRFPKLQHLTINAPAIAESGAFFNPTYIPLLQDPKLDRCEWFDRDFTTALRCFWEKPRIEVLEIVQCDGTDGDIAIVSPLNKKRLKWKIS